MMDFVKRIVLLLAFSSQLLYINVRVIFEIYFCINDVYVYFYLFNYDSDSQYLMTF